MAENAQHEAAQWYVVHTYSGYENAVKQSIIKKAENQQLTDLIPEVKIPTEIVREIKDGSQGGSEDDTKDDEDDKSGKGGKEKVHERKIFPGYVFVRMVLNNEVAYLIRSIRGVTGFLGTDPNSPVPLTPDEAQMMGVDFGEVVEVKINVGDHVHFVGTVMDGLGGVVQSVDTEAGTCVVLVPMMGRETENTISLANVVRDGE